jgi:hypothetical protein
MNNLRVERYNTKLAVDRLVNADESMEHYDACRFGVTKQLKDLHSILIEAQRRSDDDISIGLLERALLIVEAQLNY